jgi:hypothetical protein
MTGIQLITKERKEQIKKHGITVQQDKEDNTQHQLNLAAIMLTCPPEVLDQRLKNDILEELEDMGWDTELILKMLNKPYEKRLIIAGALIAAEIDRNKE